MELETLRRIGLTQNEGKIYIALLRLGTSKAGETLKESNINSGKVYDILGNLKKKGLISESIINNVRLYTASPPSEILDYIKRKKNELEQEEKMFKSSLKELEKLRNTKTKDVKTVTYVGLRGLKTAVNEVTKTLKAKDIVLTMGNTSTKDKQLNNFFLDWSHKVIAKGIHMKLLYSDKGIQYREAKKLKNVETKSSEGITPVTVGIYGDDKIIIYNWEPLTAILIYSKGVTDSFRNFFYQMWKIAKP